MARKRILIAASCALAALGLCTVGTTAQASEISKMESPVSAADTAKRLEGQPGIGQTHSVVALNTNSSSIVDGNNGNINQVSAKLGDDTTGGQPGIGTDTSVAAFNTNSVANLADQTAAIDPTYEGIDGADNVKSYLQTALIDSGKNAGQPLSGQTIVATDPHAALGTGDTNHLKTALDSSPAIGVPQPATFEGIPPLIKQQGLKTASADLNKLGIDGAKTYVKLDLTASAADTGDPSKHITLTDPTSSSDTGQALGAAQLS